MANTVFMIDPPLVHLVLELRHPPRYQLRLPRDADVELDQRMRSFFSRVMGVFSSAANSTSMGIFDSQKLPICCRQQPEIGVVGGRRQLPRLPRHRC